jgi:hypothetical protein
MFDKSCETIVYSCLSHCNWYVLRGYPSFDSFSSLDVDNDAEARRRRLCQTHVKLKMALLGNPLALFRGIRKYTASTDHDNVFKPKVPRAD